MGALPKRKISKGRRDRRRNHYTISHIQVVECETCGEFKLPHRVCKKCGSYNGREIYEVDQI